MTVPPTADPATDHSRLWNDKLVPAAGVYDIDPIHSFVGFAAQHLVVGRVRGRFERVAGTVRIGEHPIDSAVDVTIETASISTMFAARDNDLRSRFLDVATYPDDDLSQHQCGRAATRRVARARRPHPALSDPPRPAQRALRGIYHRLLGRA